MNFDKQSMYPFPLDALNQQILSQTPLHFACYAGDHELLDVLLCNPQNNNGNQTTDTRLAAMIAEEDAVNGWTPAHWAAFYGQLTCLMKLHVRPDVGFDTPSSKSHLSPLHLASQSGDILCIKWLLHCGASINRQDFAGETPLHKAAKAGSVESATMLVAHGANQDLKNQQGCTPADLAELRNHPSVLWFLKRVKQSQKDEEILSDAFGDCQFSLPVSDPGFAMTFEHCRLSPSWHFIKNRKIPPDVNRRINQPLLPPMNRSDSHITMNGVSIGSMQNSMQEESDTDISESISGTSVQSFGELDTLPSVCGNKRSLGSMNEFQSQYVEGDSGVSETHSPKRRCYGFRNEMDGPKDACNNNFPSCVSLFGEDFSSSSHTGASNMFCLQSQSSSPLQAFSSEMEHEEAMSAEQGYDSCMINAMHDFLS